MIPISIELKKFLSENTDEEIFQMLDEEGRLNDMEAEWWLNYIVKLRKENNIYVRV